MGSTRAFQAEGLAPTHSRCWEKTWDVQESRTSVLLGPMKQITEDVAGATGRDQTLAFTLETAEPGKGFKDACPQGREPPDRSSVPRCPRQGLQSCWSQSVQPGQQRRKNKQVV